MNWRLKLLSVLILGFFAAFAIGYYKYFVSPKPSGVILFIVPGLNLDNIAKTNNHDLNLLANSTRVAIVNNDVLDTHPFQVNPNTIFSYLATGYKTNGDRIGLSTDGRVQDNLLYLAQRAGRTVGVVSTSSIASVELAAFYAHTKNPNDPVDLLQQLFDNTKINVILGGGVGDFERVKLEANRDLFHEANLYGYKVVHTNDELQDVPAWRTRRLLGVFDNPPTLPDLTRRAIQCLEFNLNGYFLVVHNSLIADAIRDNHPALVTAEIEQLDRAIADARDLVGKNHVIVLYSPYNVAPANDVRADQSFGWLVVYTDNDAPLQGFATGKDLFRYLRRQLDWRKF